jgi:hypothetical protein
MKQSAAGKLWEDEDFEGQKMDAFCKEIQMALEEEVREPQEPVRILRLWMEQWELKKIGLQGNHLLEARLMCKYEGLKFCDIDEGNRVMTVHGMMFVKQRGNNAYHMFACLAMTLPLEIMTMQMILTGSSGKSTRICMIVCGLIMRRRNEREIMSRYSTKGMIVRARFNINCNVMVIHVHPCSTSAPIASQEIYLQAILLAHPPNRLARRKNILNSYVCGQ